MTQTRQILPGLCRVWQIDCRDLPPRVWHAFLMGDEVPVMQIPKRLPLCGPAEWETTMSARRGRAIYEQRLTFRTDREPELRPWTGFLAEDVRGQMWLLGQKEQPWPQAGYSRTTGQPADMGADWSVEVSLTALMGPVKARALPGEETSV